MGPHMKSAEGKAPVLTWTLGHGWSRHPKMRGAMKATYDPRTDTLSILLKADAPGRRKRRAQAGCHSLL